MRKRCKRYLRKCAIANQANSTIVPVVVEDAVKMVVVTKGRDPVSRTVEFNDE